jgi:hypothetical protein
MSWLREQYHIDIAADTLRKILLYAGRLKPVMGPPMEAE